MQRARLPSWVVKWKSHLLASSSTCLPYGMSSRLNFVREVLWRPPGRAEVGSEDGVILLILGMRRILEGKGPTLPLREDAAPF